MGKVQTHVVVALFVLGTFTLSGSVAATNQPPVLEPVGDKMIDLTVSSKLSFALDTYDPDGDAVVVAAYNLPAGANFSPANRTFWWHPTPADVGEWTDIRFEASDGSLVDAENIAIRVTASANPKITVLGSGAIAKTSPGVPVKVQYTIRNDGNAPEAVRFAAFGPFGWSVVAPKDIFLPGGSSKVVEVVVTPTADPLAGEILLQGTTASGAWSQGKANVRIPYVVLISTGLIQNHALPVTGLLVTTYLNGQPAPNVNLRLDERLTAAGIMGIGNARSITLTTGVEGRANFALPVNLLGANTPGQHQLIAQVQGPYNTDAADTEIYIVV